MKKNLIKSKELSTKLELTIDSGIFIFKSL